MQKGVTLDFLSHKRVKNRGHQPQYFIADHHPAIVSKEDWNAVQIELKHRSKMYENKLFQNHSSKVMFSNVMYCGTCGEHLIHKTCTSTRNKEKYLFPVWKCRAADGRRKDVECHARSYREDGIKHAFMAMLLEMKHEQDELVKEAKNAIVDIDLDDWEEDRMDFLKIEIASSNERLCQLVASSQESLASDVYDDVRMQLVEEIEAYQKEWGRLNEKKHEVIVIKQNLEWLIEELNKIKDFNPTTERSDFQDGIFKRIVQRGDVFDDGSIIYELNIGVTRKAKGNEQSILSIGEKRKE